MKRLCSFYLYSRSIAFFIFGILLNNPVIANEVKISKCNKNHVTAYAEYNDEIRICYKLISDLKIDAAVQKLKELRQSQKENIAIVHLENYLDFFVLFITENKSEYNKRIVNKDLRLEYLDKIKINNPNLAFIKAEILLQWALIQLKFDEKLKAGSYIYEAYKLLETNKKNYPDFIENSKSLSIIHALAESVPKWVRKIIGVKGSLSLGKAEIEQLAQFAYKNKNYIFREEVASIYSYILFYQLNQKSKAIIELDRFDLEHQSSPLVAFLKSSMYLRNGNNDLCLKTLQEYKPANNQLPFYYLDFMKGRSLLYKQDESAIKYLKNFTDHFKGQHFIKEAYQKIAWYELSINNDMVKYKSNMALCLAKGNNIVDEDQQALKEAKSNKTPNAIILKSRILFDGGYYAKAQEVLIKNAHLQDNKTTQLEFNYRMGRILQSLKNYTDAIQYFKNTISFGSHSNDYFAASASLQLGFIYEDIRQYKNAKIYYTKCLSIEPSEYKNSLHQKAKSGLERLQKY